MLIDLWMMFLSLCITSARTDPLAFLTRLTSLPWKLIHFVQICAEGNSNAAQTGVVICPSYSVFKTIPLV